VAPLVRPLGVVRFVRLSTPDRIGHLVLEIDAFLKERKLAGDDPIMPVLVYERDTIANLTMLDYWRRHLAMVELTPEVRKTVRALAALEGVEHLARYVVGVGRSAPCFEIEARWAPRPPLLQLSDDHRRRGQAALLELGMPADAWFVCVHVREGGYSPADEHLHTYRNSRIADYVPAMEEIVRRGGWCVRVGDATMQPLGALPGVIDYARSPAKSDWMDVFLGASCRFFLGSSSGLFLIATAFGRPSALANMAPIGCAFPVGVEDLGIPKLLRHGGEVLSFRRALEMDTGVLRHTDAFAERGLENVDNAPDEITDLAIEMLDRLDRRLVYDAADEARQQRFRALFRPVHYSHGAASRIGSAFLRKHERLLQ
jgi:putative glycosyltransferase (TIGR04372 family)